MTPPAGAPGTAAAGYREPDPVTWRTRHGDLVTVWSPTPGDWRWHVQAENHRVLEQGEGHTRKADAVRAAERHHPRWPAAADRSSVSPLAVLDQLDELRVAASAGEWQLDGSDNVFVEYEHNGEQYTDGLVSAAYTTHADAELIVAAVNAAPALVTIVREWWDEHDGRTCVDRTGRSLHGDEPCATRAFIARTLAGER